MDFWGIVWPTLVATFIATLPAVIIGIWIERTIERRRRNKTRTETDGLAATAHDEMMKTFVEAGGILYETRDTARRVLSLLEEGQPIGYGVSRNSTTIGLTYLLNSGQFPAKIRGLPVTNTLALLADNSAVLNQLIVKHFGESIAPASQLYEEFHNLAEMTFGHARILIRTVLNEPI